MYFKFKMSEGYCFFLKILKTEDYEKFSAATMHIIIYNEYSYACKEILIEMLKRNQCDWHL